MAISRGRTAQAVSSVLAALFLVVLAIGVYGLVIAVADAHAAMDSLDGQPLPWQPFGLPAVSAAVLVALWRFGPRLSQALVDSESGPR